MAKEFEGRVVIVTGSTSGIGAATAEAFGRAGDTVVVTGRRADEGERVAERIGPAATFVQADLTDDDQAIGVVHTTIERFGRIDCLINNAGTPGNIASITELDLAVFGRTLAIHLRAPLLLIQQVAPHMIAQGGGSIINVASVNGQRAGFAGHDYSIAKAAMIHLTRCAAVELAAHEIRVNTISPGPVLTDIFAKASGRDECAPDVEDTLLGLLAPWQPYPHIGKPGDIAELAVFLAGAGARYLNGQNISVDGALTAGRPWSTVLRERARLAEAVGGSV